MVYPRLLQPEHAMYTKCTTALPVPVGTLLIKFLRSADADYAYYQSNRN